MSRVKKSSKREEIREKRRKQQQRQRLLIVAIILGVTLILLGVVVIPGIIQRAQDSSTPVGDIVIITPYPRPNAQGTALGDPNAPVKIDIFEDFQCPSCQLYTEQIAKQVIDTYVATGKVYYTFHQFPIVDRNAALKESHQAANASMCASEQGRFWDYHDMLYANWNGENQGSLRDKRLIAFAEAIGLDMNAFQTCFSENRYKDQINADLALGNKWGVKGTPSLFVNGLLIRPGYVPQFTDIQQAVEAALGGK